MADLVWTLPDGSDVATWAAAGGGDSSSGAIQMESVTLTSPQILDLFNTPVEILPAPPGRFYYAIHYVIVHYRFATTPYTGSGEGLTIGYGSTAEDLTDQNGVIGQILQGQFFGVPLVDFLTLTEDAYVLLSKPYITTDYTGWLASKIEGKAISVIKKEAEWEDGDGTLTIRVFYSLIDGAP